MVALLSTSIRKKVLLVAAVGWLFIDPRMCFATTIIVRIAATFISFRFATLVF